MNQEERHALYKEAVQRWGVPAQMDMLIEECSELIDAVCKRRRGRVTDMDVASEIADVQICSEQIGLLLREKNGYDMVEEVKKIKLARLAGRLKQAAEEQLRKDTSNAEPSL